MKLKKILVVDDEIDVCSILCDYLKDSFDVEVAYNGEEAVSKANRFSPDCVLLDIVMPKMNGVQAAKLIKTNLPNAEIIMLTATGNDAMIEQCLAAGAGGYIWKPVDLDALTNMIEATLSKK